MSVISGNQAQQQPLPASFPGFPTGTYIQVAVCGKCPSGDTGGGSRPRLGLLLVAPREIGALLGVLGEHGVDSWRQF